MIVRNIKEDFYNIISNSNLFILASINIDSLCAVKIITSLLSSENIKYALTAVENREDLTACINENKNIYKKFLLVNCGGNFDLSSCLTEIEDIIIFVIDSHLPYNVENIYSATNVRLIINNNECLENIPEFNILFQTEESDEDRTFFNNERDNARQKYERFFSYGTPCAITMFDMSSKLGKDVIEYVWYAICGLTELFILRKMNNEKYISNILYLQQQVLRLSTSNNDPSACFNIISDNVLQIYLYTHWTLMDSLLKSPATSSHFQVWSFNGRKRLHGFLADMGIPLAQCKQSYISMESDIRNSVKESIMSYSSKFGLNDISYPSFTAQFGYRCKITAADYVLTLISAIDYCKDDGENRKCRFLEALRILNIQNVSHLEEQIKIVKSMMSDIAQNVGYFVELHYIICAGPFLFGAATEDREKNQFISNPLILDIISNYALLTHSNLTKSKRAKELPFVLTIPIYDTEHSVIIGIPSLNSPTLLHDLHIYFKKAIELSKITVVSRGFYPAFIVIQTSERTPFFDSLVTVMENP